MRLSETVAELLRDGVHPHLAVVCDRMQSVNLYGSS